MWVLNWVSSVLFVWPGKDVATNVEVYWPDGRSVARPLEPSEMNSVMEIHYPRDDEEITPTVEIEVQQSFTMLRGSGYLQDYITSMYRMRGYYQTTGAARGKSTDMIRN